MSGRFHPEWKSIIDWSAVTKESYLLIGLEGEIWREQKTIIKLLLLSSH